ncbi:hypothetical protein Tco_0435271 [Tanacetum coccineum]
MNNRMCLTLEDAEKSQLKMNEFQKVEKVQELKIQPSDYEKLNELYFVPQKELYEPSVKQTCFSPYYIPFVKILETKTMPSELPLINELFNIKVGVEKLSLLIHQNSKRESIFYTSPKEIKRIEFCQKQVKPILNELQVYFKNFQNLFLRDIKEMKDAFEQNDVYLDEIENQNDLLKDQLLEASLTEDIKNLGLSKRIVELEKDLSKSEAKCIAFEIAHQHKSRENNSLKTVQKENENFMASLQLENAHLKQTYKDLFESVQRTKVETIQCDEVRVKDDFDEIETKNIELEYQKQLDISEFNKGLGKNVCDNAKCEFQTKFFELDKVLTQQTKDFDDVKLELSNRTAKFEAYFEKLKKMKVVLERQLARKVDDSKAENFDKHSILGKPPADKLLINSQISKSWFTPKVDVQKSLSKPFTAQSLPKTEKDQLLKQIGYLESKLASKGNRSCQKEYHELRTSYNALKVQFDSLNRKRRETNASKSSKPKVNVLGKVHTGESSKSFSRRVS